MLPRRAGRRKGDKPKGKGQGKGNGQDNGKTAKDKRELCRDWNKGRCTQSSPAHLKARPHFCSRCGGNHLATKCRVS